VRAKEKLPYVFVVGVYFKLQVKPELPKLPE
jgi:hypothetical protein